jgi:hypothetical protein
VGLTLRTRVATVPRTAASAIFALVGCGLAPIAAAQQTVIVERNVNLRRDPSSNQAAIRLILPPEELELQDTTKVNNYYHVVRAESHDTGWVWASNVRREPASGPVVATAFEPTTPAPAIDTSWQKPAPATGTFTSPVENVTCGPTGDGGDSATNRRKNRTDVPQAYHEVAWSAIADLGYPATRATDRSRWPAESLAVLEPYEGVALRTVGYLVALKPQTSGSGESTNCHMKRSAEVDWHVAIVGQEGDGEDAAIVVEPTPRIRVNHPKWTPTRLSPWLDSPNPVRISGWLMFDPAHRNHLGRFRKTLWEIHPVTRIEVWQEGSWVDLDSLP